MKGGARPFHRGRNIDDDADEELREDDDGIRTKERKARR
jgi:hypothetical protein